MSMMPVAAAAPCWATVCSNLANEAEHARVPSHAPTRLITPRLAGQIQLFQPPCSWFFFTLITTDSYTVVLLNSAIFICLHVTHHNPTIQTHLISVSHFLVIVGTPTWNGHLLALRKNPSFNNHHKCTSVEFFMTFIKGFICIALSFQQWE